VLVEYLVELDHADRVRTFINRALSDRDVALAAPDLVFPEATSALRRLVRLQKINATEADWAATQLARFPLIAESSRGLIEDAWSMREQMSIYDACYVALARRLDGEFVSTDGPLVRRLRQRRERVEFLGDES